MKKYIKICLVFLFVSFSFGQDLSFSFSSDIVTRYIWRGNEFGKYDFDFKSTPHIQPTAALTLTTASELSISLGLWGSYGFNGNYSETDLYLNFLMPTNIGDLSLTFNDYFYPYYGISFTNFDGDGLGGHTLELNFSFQFKEKFPLKFMISKNIHNDIKDDNSLYFELGYPIQISDVNIDLFAGVAQGKSIWHNVDVDKFSIVNTGFTAKKSLKISETFSLPISLSWVYNPHKKITYLVGKITI